MVCKAKGAVVKKIIFLLLGTLSLTACQRDLCSYRQELIEKPLYFKFNSDEIQDKSLADLTEGAKFLTCHRFRRVHLDGYADKIGGVSEYNTNLSYRRAQKVKDFLVEHGVTERYITISGNGVLSSDIPDWKKRRVDVTIK